MRQNTEDPMNPWHSSMDFNGVMPGINSAPELLTCVGSSPDSGISGTIPFLPDCELKEIFTQHPVSGFSDVH